MASEKPKITIGPASPEQSAPEEVRRGPLTREEIGAIRKFENETDRLVSEVEEGPQPEEVRGRQVGEILNARKNISPEERRLQEEIGFQQHELSQLQGGKKDFDPKEVRALKAQIKGLRQDLQRAQFDRINEYQGAVAVAEAEARDAAEAQRAREILRAEAQPEIPAPVAEERPLVPAEAVPLAEAVPVEPNEEEILDVIDASGEENLRLLNRTQEEADAETYLSKEEAKNYKKLLADRTRYQGLLREAERRDGGRATKKLIQNYERRIDNLEWELDDLNRQARWEKEDYLNSEQYYRDRIDNLQETLGAAEKEGDEERAARLQSQIDRLEEKADPSSWKNTLNPLNWRPIRKIADGMKYVGRRAPVLGIVIGGPYAVRELLTRESNKEKRIVGPKWFNKLVNRLPAFFGEGEKRQYVEGKEASSGQAEPSPEAPLEAEALTIENANSFPQLMDALRQHPENTEEGALFRNDELMLRIRAIASLTKEVEAGNQPPERVIALMNECARGGPLKMKLAELFSQETNLRIKRIKPKALKKNTRKPRTNRIDPQPDAPVRLVPLEGDSADQEVAATEEASGTPVPGDESAKEPELEEGDVLRNGQAPAESPADLAAELPEKVRVNPAPTPAAPSRVRVTSRLEPEGVRSPASEEEAPHEKPVAATEQPQEKENSHGVSFSKENYDRLVELGYDPDEAHFTSLGFIDAKDNITIPSKPLKDSRKRRIGIIIENNDRGKQQLGERLAEMVRERRRQENEEPPSRQEQQTNAAPREIAEVPPVPAAEEPPAAETEASQQGTVTAGEEAPPPNPEPDKVEVEEASVDMEKARELAREHIAALNETIKIGEQCIAILKERAMPEEKNLLIGLEKEIQGHRNMRTEAGDLITGDWKSKSISMEKFAEIVVGEKWRSFLEYCKNQYKRFAGIGEPKPGPKAPQQETVADNGERDSQERPPQGERENPPGGDSQGVAGTPSGEQGQTSSGEEETISSEGQAEGQAEFHEKVVGAQSLEDLRAVLTEVGKAYAHDLAELDSSVGAMRLRLQAAVEERDIVALHTALNKTLEAMETTPANFTDPVIKEAFDGLRDNVIDGFEDAIGKRYALEKLFKGKAKDEIKGDEIEGVVDRVKKVKNFWKNIGRVYRKLSSE